MTSTLIKITTITAISAAAIMGLSACSTASSTTPSASPSASAQLIGPVVVDVATLNGTTVTVNSGQMIDITTGTNNPADYTATIATPAVASFTKGGTDGSATFNPGITGLKTGTTMVALTDITSAMTINFTVVVK